jgi:glutamate---cysteine ligase / carboxylate-amine ligase
VENKWHAQRYGVSATFVDPFRRQPMNASDWLNEVLDFIHEDVKHFGCAGEIGRLTRLIDNGTSADRQIEVYEQARETGRSRLRALREVVDWAAAQTRDVDGARGESFRKPIQSLAPDADAASMPPAK